MKSIKTKREVVKGLPVAVLTPKTDFPVALIPVLDKLSCQIIHQTDLQLLLKSCKNHPAKALFVDADSFYDFEAEYEKNSKAFENTGVDSLFIMANESQVGFAAELAHQFNCFLITGQIGPEELAVLISRALDMVLLNDRIKRYECANLNTEFFGSVVAKSVEMKEVVRVAKILATRDDPLLLVGAIGTGKSLLAKTIHETSSRRYDPFYSVNCKSYSNEDLTIEIFGKDDAESDEKSLLELSSDGTLFLDDVSEISPALQGKLQRFLEDKSYTKVNSRKVYSSNVRICAGTSIPLDERVLKGEFSEELFLYLSRFILHIPPLRRRLEDIPVLIETILKETAKIKGLDELSITEDALKHLVEYNWPGNIRELRNALDYASLVSEGKRIESTHLPKQFHDEVGSIYVGANPNELPELDEIERQYILKVMDACKGNKVKAAAILEVNRATLHRKLGIYAAQQKKAII